MASPLRFELPVHPEGVVEDGVGVQWQHVYGLAAAANGLGGWGRQWNLSSFTHDTEYLQVLRNLGSGGRHLSVLKSTDASAVLSVLDTGLTTPLQITSTLATGTAPFAISSTTVVANLNADLLDGQHASAFLTEALADLRYLQLTGGTVTGNLAVQGNTTLGDGNADVLTVVGLSTFRNSASSATQLYVDAGNNRVIVGAATALTSAADDRFTVSGGSAYVAANSTESALGLRYSAAATGSFFVGASNSNTPDGVFKTSAGTQIARLFNGGGLLVGTNTALAGSEKLEVQSGGLRVTAGGILLAGSGNIDGNGGTAGQLRIGAVIVNAASLDGSEELLVNGQSKLKGDVTITTGTFRHENSGNARIEANATGVGFFGATPIARPTVIGTRTGTLAQLQGVMANLLAALGGGQLGLITDSTT